MGAAWFLSWLGHWAPVWLYLLVLFGVPVALVVWAWWARR